MIKINKYKLFKNTHFFLHRFPWRILRFYREKWFELRKKINKLKINESKLKKKGRYKRRPKEKRFFIRFKTLDKKFFKKTRWIKVKTLYKREFISKRLFYILFNRGIKLKFLKQQKKNTNYIESKVNFLIKPYFRQDIILWKLNFFNSVRESRQFLARGCITLNSKIIKKIHFLVKGDITEITKYSFNLRNLRKKHSKNKKFLSFIEIDYYTNTLIVIKQLNNLYSYDFPLLIEESFLTKSLRHVF